MRGAAGSGRPRLLAAAWAALCLSCAQAAFTPALEEEEALGGLHSPRPVAFTPEDDLAPSASRDGRFLAFASEQNGNLDVWIRDWGTNSTYPITLDSAEDFDPSVSPDAERVAFVSRRDDAKGDLFVTSIATAGKGLERLTGDSTYDRQPIYSADGARLYFTSAIGIGAEFIAEIDAGGGEPRRISPTPGFDPAPSPDGRFLVYTAPRGVGGRSAPHLVALRLADSATRALTRADRPEGFARFARGVELERGATSGIVYVRFADDDNDDGVIDARDQASLWRMDLDLDVLFARPSAPRSDPFPLTDGSDDDLFPDVQAGQLYLTRGGRQQDILRLPATGVFPAYTEPADYMKLAAAIDEPRTKWFAYRLAAAKSPPGSLGRAQALLRIGNIHLERQRPDLAREAFEALTGELAGSKAGTPEAELWGVARVELAGLARREGLRLASRPLDRERVLRATRVELDALAVELSSTPRALARIDLELAEVLVDQGERTRAIEAFEAVVSEHGDQPFSAARAMLRRIELLGIAHDPDALGEAYAHVLQRFPDQREAVKAASERIVDVQLGGLAAGADWTAQADALTRLIPRFGASPVRSTARWRAVRLLREHGALEAAALQLEQLAVEAAGDRLLVAKALEELALINEERGRLDDALARWGELRGGFRDLPGYDAEAREAINRVGQRKAALEEQRGDKEAARAAYAGIIDNDLTQVKAHRRYLALSAETGKLDDAIEVAKQRAERSSRTPMARYAYGLALTWTDPPSLDEALVEIEAALELNPQFTHAYVTRGWILEMKELVRPGVLGELWDGVVEFANSAVSGLLDVNIGEADYLLQAIDDYQRALQLNRESEDPDTEAEIKLNEANASFRLGDKTNDVGNVKKAFSRYVDVLNSGYRFHSPIAELVYFERFGRAAAWSEEWAVSTMATRRAIALARRLGQSSRLAMLYGNLSLAYDQAGEDAYASAALAASAGLLEEERLERRLLIARRNRAAAKLDDVLATPELLDSALLDLEGARSVIGEVELGHGDAPIWRGAIEDASSAQYGFGSIAELNVNLALAARAHAARGDVSRAEAIGERRRAISAAVLDDIPKLMGAVRREPVTLLMLRDRLGLAVSHARARFAAGDRSGALSVLAEAKDELDAWGTNNEELLRDRPALLIDRSRLAAISAELLASAGVAQRPEGLGVEEGSGSGPRPDPGVALAVELELAARIDAELAVALEQLDEALVPPDKVKTSTAVAELIRAAKVEDPVLAGLPEVLSSTSALAVTATIALSKPRLEGIPREVRATRARVLYARGLGKIAAARRSSAEGGAELPRLIAGLDASLALLAEARATFESAARQAAGAGFGQGGRVLAMSLDASAAISRTLRDRDPSLVTETEQLARRIARVMGREDLAARFELASALARPEPLPDGAAIVGRTLPIFLAKSLPLARAVLARTASAALAAGDPAGALSAIDLSLLLDVAAGPYLGPLAARDPTDRAAAVELRQDLARLEALDRALAAHDASTPEQAFQELRRSIDDTVAELAAAPRGAVSPGARARMFAGTIPVVEIAKALGPTEVMLIVAPIDGVAHVFLADGSTTAPDAERLLHRETKIAEPALRAALARARAAVAAGRGFDAADAELLAQVYAEPFRQRLATATTVIVVDLLAGGPVPQSVLAGGAGSVTYASSLTSHALARAEQLFGVSGTVALAPHDGSAPLVDAEHRLLPADALGFVRPEPSVLAAAGRGPGADGAAQDDEARSLGARPPAELLADRGQRLLVVEAPLSIEPAAPERSVISLGALRPKVPPLGVEVEDPDEVEEAYRAELAVEVERFAEELPLEALDVPARTLVLASVSDRPPGNTRRRLSTSERVRLDLALAARGFATAIVVPEPVPRAAVRRIIARYVELEEERGPARALSAAIAEEVAVTPSAGSILLIGAPGLDREGRKRFAAGAIDALKKRALALYSGRQLEGASRALERLVRVLREAEDEKQLPAVYTLLVAALEKKPSPSPARAADVQAELVRFLDGRPKSPATEKALANARADLGRILGLAGDHAAAEETLEAAISELERLGDRLNAARATLLLGQHFDRNRSDFKRAAELLERAISLYEAERAFAAKPPVEAMQAVRSIGALYLNRLSDPARAEAAYERALRYAQSEDDRNIAIISLARVARRRGDLMAAAQRADRARSIAVKNNQLDREADALIEAANVAWFQGDYRRGQDLCAESLGKVQALIRLARSQETVAAKLAAEGKKVYVLRDQRKRRIYALSACGLIAMSRRELTRAIDQLEQARAIAEELADKPEIAAQWNNLGRVYLEFGRVGEAIAAFERAMAIDEALQDRFGLAYDLRNVGTALAFEKRYEEAEKALRRGLAYAVDVQDSNNELRARFALAELARDRGDAAAARAGYLEALPLAEGLDVKELDWQIHRALGLIAADEGRLAEAEAELEKAIRIVRAITGRSAASDFGPHRYAAFDDLVSLLLGAERVDKAFTVANLARSLEETEVLDDARIRFRSPEIPGLLATARAARTSTGAEAAVAELTRLDPRLAELIEPASAASITPLLPEDAAVVMYRVADQEVITFVLEREGVTARRAAIGSRRLGELVREYGRRLQGRADLATASGELAEVLIDPIRDLIGDKQRLAFVPHRSLRYVAFPALPLGSGSKALLVDHFVITQALGPRGAARALAEPLGPVGALPIVAFGGIPPGPRSLEPPLPFSRKEVEVIAEEHPSAVLYTGAAATKEALLERLRRSTGVIHFAGHSRLGGGAASGYVDPLGGDLGTSDAGTGVLDVISERTSAALVVLSACSSMLARGDDAGTLTGDELLSLAEAFHLAGAGSVLATTVHVDDIAASMVMKRFYRAARRSNAAAALREAQLDVRRHHPHPAWWATYALLSR